MEPLAPVAAHVAEADEAEGEAVTVSPVVVAADEAADGQVVAEAAGEARANSRISEIGARRSLR
jgi:hypothetical protein